VGAFGNPHNHRKSAHSELLAGASALGYAAKLAALQRSTTPMPRSWTWTAPALMTIKSGWAVQPILWQLQTGTPRPG